MGFLVVCKYNLWGCLTTDIPFYLGAIMGGQAFPLQLPIQGKCSITWGLHR